MPPQRERYRAALLFGSLVRGDAGEASDVDARVVVDRAVTSCRCAVCRVGPAALAEQAT